MRRRRAWSSLTLFLLLTLPLSVFGQADTQPPLVQSRFPAAGSLVQGLNSVEVIFNEPVAGVDPSDLLINDQPATDILYGIAGQFVFEFSSPATGQVTIAFAPGHGITDLATPPNAFAGDSWTLTLDPNSQPATFLITEFMADNKQTLNDENGDQSDWIEIYNPRDAAGNLEGWFLTDDAGNLTKWRFPNRTLEAKTYLVVFASSKNRTNATGNLHTSFQLSSGGEYLALVDPNTNIVSAFAPVFPPQQPDVSYGRDRANPSIVGYFTKPTPRGPNVPGGPGFVPEVQFSRNSGTFSTNRPFALTLSNSLPSAVIYYALGTNLPASNSVTSFLYTGPIQVTNTLAVRARAFANNLLPGPITTKSYICLADQTNVINFNSDLPIMIIHNYGQGTIPADKTAKRYVFVQTFESNCGRTSMTNSPTLAVRGSLHTRGSSTLTASTGQAAFTLEVRDEFDDDLEVPMLGLPAESDWVLYCPNNFEPALYHNPLAFALARDMGQYASRSRFFEVFLKDDAGAPGAISSGDYWGIYVLEEKIKRDNNRVNISKLEPEHSAVPEVTGGYMFSIDRPAPLETQLSVTGAGLNWIEPGYFTMTNAVRQPQVNWIRGYFNAFGAGLAGNDYTNRASTNYYGNYIDIDSWVTRHIHEVVTFNVDGFRLSGYFFKDRGKKIEYGPAWDYDRTQGSTDGRDFNPRIYRSPVSDFGTDFFNFSPWWNRLMAAPDFWQAYIDKYQYYRRPGNALSSENVAGQINRLANELREAQPREQAKWSADVPRSGVRSSGGYSYDFGPTVAYQNEVNFTLSWYSNRLDFMDTNFLAPPILSSSGGPITNGSIVTLNPGSKPGSSIIYTLDGTDPRLSGGAVSPSAFSNLSSVTVTMTSNVSIMARSFNPSHRNQTGPNNPPISSPWSGPVEASFYLSLPTLRITELMYHPADPPAGSPNNADDFEYIEFTNIGADPLNLNRFHLRSGVDFDFVTGTLNPGESGVIVRDANAFLSRYGSGPRVLGVYTNDHLNNGGDHLRLLGPLDEPILDFSYNDKWYPATDGTGFSLVIVNLNASTTTWGLKESWRPSGTFNGSPGASEPAVNVPPVVINEISTHTDPPSYDAIELHNPTTSTADVGGWYLTDNFNSPTKFRIPNGTTIGASGYLTFFATNQANPALAFGRAFNLASTGGEVYVFSGNPATSNLTGYAQGFDFGPQANGVTFGRYIVSTGGDQFPAQSSPSLSGPNAGPKVGPIVISEISYHPPDLQFTYRAVDNCIDEYIELQNTGNATVPLYDPLHPTNTWALRDAVRYSFPPGVSIPAGGVILVVAIDPSHVDQADGFRARNGVPANTPLYGPWSGQLANSTASVELVRPDSPNPTAVPQILVERVRYSDDPPWPQAADGFGPVLQRVSPTSYGNDPANWVAGVKTPGAPFTPGAGPGIATQPTNTTVIEGTTASFTVGATGSSLTYQWLFNGKTFSGPTANSATLTLSGIRLTQAGTYSCIVFNPSGAVVSSNANLSIRPLPRILQNPVNVGMRGSTNTTDYGNATNNATFSVVATGTGTLRYQWRKNGLNLSGANSPVLVVPNVTLADDASYDVQVTDEIATLTTTPARLTVLLSPLFLVSPANQTVVSNGTFTANAVIKGNPTPFRWEWREISTVRGSNVVNDTTNFFTSAPITNLAGRTWRLVVFNEANLSPGSVAQFTVTALADSDGDGLPDSWETQYGFNPLDGSDRNQDADHDGITNYGEWLAGTNPTNASSNVRVDLTTTPGNALISVGVLSNRTYTVQSSDVPVGGTWSKLGDIVARPTDRIETLFDSSGRTNRYYRVVTPRQP